MYKMLKKAVPVLFLLMAVLPAYTQSLVAPEALSSGISRSYCLSVNEKLEKYNNRINNLSGKFIKKMLRKMNRLCRSTGLNTDSVFRTSKTGALLYAWENGLPEVAAQSAGYHPYLDTLAQSLSFLNGEQTAGTQLMNLAEAPIARLKNAEQQTQFIEKIQAAIREQEQLLQQMAPKYKKAVQQYLLSVNKHYSFFSARFTEYRNELTGLLKPEERLLSLLRELPAFRAFMKEHSLIAGLFSIPAAEGVQLNGLQTRSMLQTMLKEKMSSASPGIEAVSTQQMQTAYAKMNNLKQKLPGNGTAADMTDYAPKEIKSKTFLQRVELGSNFRVLRAAQLFPAKSELMLTAGYKISDRGSLGVGFTHWLGWGESIRKISFSHQGHGFSSWLKFGLKNNLFINGGWEHNYFSQVKNMTSPGTTPAWKSSALLGISKRVGAGKSFLGSKWGANRKRISEITLLYDFLYKQNNPITEAFKLRFGFTF